MKKIRNPIKRFFQTRSEQQTEQQLIWLDQLNTIVSDYTSITDTPEVQMALERISELVGSMTIHLKRNTDKGDERIVDGLSRKIDIEPCTTMTRSIWMQAIVRNMLVYGNCIVLPTYTQEGYVDELNILDMRTISYVEKNGRYQIKTADGVRFDHDEVLHFRLNPRINKPWIGRGYQVYLRDIAKQLNVSRKTITEYMENRIMPSVVIKVDALTEEMTEQEGKESIYERYVKRTSAGQPFIIPADLIDIMTIDPVSLKDVAVDSTIDIGKETVASIFGVPSFLLGVGDFDEKEFNHFVRTRIMPIGKIISEELTKKLLYSPDMYFKFNPRSLYAYDTLELASVGADMFTKGVMTGNEVRDWIDLGHKDGLDELMLLENYIKLEDIGNQGKLKKGDDD